jgi:hypothetical protein
MLHDLALAIEQAKRADILDVAKRLGAKLRKGGSEWIGPCPKCGGRDRFAINPKKHIFNCRGCATGGDVISLTRLVHDWDFIEAVEFVNGQSIKEARQTTPAERIDSAEEARKAVSARKKIVREIRPILVSGPGERFFRENRCIDTDAISDILACKDAIGWNPSVFFNQPDPAKPDHEHHGKQFGCIVAILTDPVTAKSTGSISRTYIGPDGKKIGTAKNLDGARGIVRLSPDEDVTHGLHLGEGIETCLAAAALGLRPIWSTGSATTMAKFPVLTGIGCLTLIADHDANGAGERAAREAEARWLQAGREVRILRAKTVGHDLNDALKGS